MKCRHDPFKINTLVIESHWAAGVRIRCRVCGFRAGVERRGRVAPEVNMNNTIKRLSKQTGAPT